MENSIEKKVIELLALTSNFIFPEYYTHTGVIMWKILNEYTPYSQEKYVLFPVSEGIEKSLDSAIKEITKAKDKFYEQGKVN